MQPTRECVSELTLVALRMHGPNVSSLQGLQWALYAIMLHVRAMVARRLHMLFRQPCVILVLVLILQVSELIMQPTREV